MSDLLKQLASLRLPVATDQKVGGSSPSERAQVRGPLPDPEGAFLLLLGATLGATGTYQPPNRRGTRSHRRNYTYNAQT